MTSWKTIRATFYKRTILSYYQFYHFKLIKYKILIRLTKFNPSIRYIIQSDILK